MSDIPAPPPAPQLDPATVIASCESIADVFAVLWEFLNQWTSPHDLADGTRKPAINDSPEKETRTHWRGRRCREFSEVAEALRMADSEELPQEVRKYLLDDDLSSDYVPALGSCDAAGPDRAFVVALAIDEVFGEIHPALHDDYDDLTSGLKLLSGRYAVDRRYNRDLDLGQVVPTAPGTAMEREFSEYDARRTALAWRSKSIAAHFKYLTCIPPLRQPAYHIRMERLAGYGELRLPTDRLPRIAVVPLAESQDDVRVVERNGDEKSYSVEVEDEPGNPRRGRLAQRAAQAIEGLADAGYEIAVFPELVVTPAISEAIRAALAKAALRLTRRPAAGRLQLVVAGSGLNQPDADLAPYNECRVYSGFGQLLWSQRKHNHFQVAAADLEALGATKARSLTTLAGKPVEDRYCEHMSSGWEFVVADCKSARMVVTICEDFSHSYLADQLGAALRPDWVFVPVMDTELAPRRWTWAQASHWGKHGCSTVVANSLVLPRVRPFPAGKKPPCDFVIGMIAGPRVRPERYFSVHLPKAASDQPLLALEALPWVDKCAGRHGLRRIRRATKRKRKAD